MRTYLTILILSLFAAVGHSQCISSSLEDGTYAGWDKLIGLTGIEANIESITTTFQTSDTNLRFKRYRDKTLTDPFVGEDLLVVPPGASYSIRLGDFDDGSKGERMKKSFVVTEQTELFTFRFAAVSEQPGHPINWQPLFGAQIRDQNDSVLFCTDILYIPGFTNFQTKSFSKDNGAGNSPTTGRWVDWQTLTLDLRPFMGQNVTVEIANGDCVLGSHFSYGYFNIECQGRAALDYNWCMKDDQVLVVAPPGFETKTWNNGDMGDTALYFGFNEGDSLICVLESDNGCVSEIKEVFEGTDVNANFLVQFDTSLIAAVFYNASNAYKASVDSVWWDFGDGNGDTTFNPIYQYDDFGIYDVTLYAFNDSGCVDSTTRRYEFYPPSYPDFETLDSCGLQVGFINRTKPPVVGEVTGYEWYFGDGDSASGADVAHIYDAPGTYQVKLVSISYGVKRDSIFKKIVVHPFPEANFLDDPACVGNPTKFSDSSFIREGSIVAWDWTFADIAKGDSTEEWVTFPEPGLFDVSLRVTSAVGCVDETQKRIEVYPQTLEARFDWEPKRVEVLEPEVQFLDSSSNASSWTWIIDGVEWSSDSSPLIAFPQDTTTYVVQLVVRNEFGCVDDTTRSLTVEPIYALYIPTAYTPDGDGFNDEYIVKGEGVQKFRMTVTDRWGKEVIRWNKMNVPVPFPEDIPIGSYGFEVYALDKYGREHEKSGTITILR